MDIKGIAPHISYEIEMFEIAAQRLAKQSLDQFEKNAFLEAFVIHARCLIDFLYPPKDLKSDDVIVDHFIDNKEKYYKFRPKMNYLSNIRSRTGKEIAHLTYKRLEVTTDMKPWQIIKIHEELNKVLAHFFNCLTDEKKTWFPTIVKE